jgi:mono/diheme cytochrome c family protein
VKPRRDASNCAVCHGALGTSGNGGIDRFANHREPIRAAIESMNGCAT